MGLECHICWFDIICNEIHNFTVKKLSFNHALYTVVPYNSAFIFVSNICLKETMSGWKLLHLSNFKALWDDVICFVFYTGKAFLQSFFIFPFWGRGLAYRFPSGKISRHFFILYLEKLEEGLNVHNVIKGLYFWLPILNFVEEHTWLRHLISNGRNQRIEKTDSCVIYCGSRSPVPAR